MIAFRGYHASDLSACLALFDANCPDFFAPNERDEYVEFLAGVADYQVCLDGDRVAGAYGLEPHADASLSLRWIMLARDLQGRGLGSSIMRRVMDESRDRGVRVIHIAASHKSAPFFSRHGAREQARTVNGWGPGMDRVDMQLDVR